MFVGVLLLFANIINAQTPRASMQMIENIHDQLINHSTKSEIRNSFARIFYFESIDVDILMGRNILGDVITYIFNEKGEISIVNYKIRCDGSFVYDIEKDYFINKMESNGYLSVKSENRVTKNGKTIRGYVHKDWKFSAGITMDERNWVLEVGFKREPVAKYKKAQQIYEEKYRKEKEMEKAQEQERIARQKEQERQERLKKEKEVREVLMELDVTKITSDVTDYFNDKYAGEIKRWERRLSTYELKYVGEVNVLLCVDSLGADIVKVENDIVNGGLNILMQSSTLYYTLDDVDYYKSQNKIFFTKSIQVKTKTYKHGYSGGKNKGRYFKYYVNVPNEVKKACEQNFMKRGEYFFEYTTVDGDVSVKELNGLERQQKDEIRGRKTTGRKILNIGGIMLLVGICVGSL